MVAVSLPHSWKQNPIRHTGRRKAQAQRVSANEKSSSGVGKLPDHSEAENKHALRPAEGSGRECVEPTCKQTTTWCILVFTSDSCVSIYVQNDGVVQTDRSSNLSSPKICAYDMDKVPAGEG